MARPPAGPMGNSPRDVRDDAVGVPAENVVAPEPPRWPPKPKKITKDTFHAKVSGGKAPKRADRAPHFRKGGWVSGYASGGNVQKKREELPSENKNDPFAKQNLKGGGGVKKKLADGGEIETPNKPPVMPDKPFEHTGSDEGGPGLSEENTAQKVARRINTINRTVGLPPNQGAASVQRYSDMDRAQKISDAVPRRGLAGPGYKDGGKLSAAQRQSLPKSDFALPGAGKGPKGAGSGSYPINNPSHARNALARSSGKPEVAEVRAKVKAKYPGIGQK